MTERREYAGPKPTGTDYTTTGYGYTPSGAQETVTGPDKTKWSYTYDLFGRQVTATDPDKGLSTTEYNNLDQVVSTTPNKDASRKLLYEYDVLGRKTGMWQTDKTDGNKLAAWTFDSLYKGQQDTAVRYDGGLAGKAYTQEVTAYDNLYRVTGSKLTLPESDREPLVAAGVPRTLSFTTGYRLDGTISQASQPAVAGLASEMVKYTYNATGQQLTSLGTTGYLQGASFSPQGDLTQLALGVQGGDSAKKAYLNWQYEPGTRRLTRAFVTDDVHGFTPQDLKFTQDDAGNVTSIFDTATQGDTTKADYQCFTYDGYSRLTESWTPKAADCAASGRAMSNIDGAAPYWNSYTYTDAGQRKTETRHTASGDSTTTYTYNATTDTKPHTLDATSGATAATYRYDDSGNTTSRPGPSAQQTLAWNTEGKLAKTTEGTKETGYLYDASGELLIRRATGDGDTVLYLGGTEVRLTTKGTTKTLSGTRYYGANGQTIAVRTAVSGTSGTKLNFLASDHHGTSSVALDSGTYAITKRYTSPFGASRGSKSTNWPDDKTFLGKPADGATGLTHVGAREYDPGIGQFISVDPLLEVDKPQTLNGYSYAVQNPLTHSDPTGLGLPCKANGGDDTPCPSRPDGTPGNGRPNEAVDPSKPKPPYVCNSSCGTASTDSSGQTMVSDDGQVLACAYGHCVGNVDVNINIGNSNELSPYQRWYYGPQPEREPGLKGIIDRLLNGPFACNPGYPCEDEQIAVVPVAPGGPAGRPMPGPRRIPMGFGNSSEFQAFKSQLNEGLRRAGHENVTPIMQGSSVTGRSFKAGRPFGQHSDFDIALAGKDLLAKAKDAGIALRSQGTRTGPLEPADLAALGLRDLSKSLSSSAGGRDVHFMIYGSAEGAVGRAPSIIMWP